MFFISPCLVLENDVLKRIDQLLKDERARLMEDVQSATQQNSSLICPLRTLVEGGGVLDLAEKMVSSLILLLT